MMEIKLSTVVEKLSHLMKVLVANPEVPWRVAESLTVVVPVAVEKLFVVAMILLYKYPAVTAGRRLSWTWSITDSELFCIFVASWNVRRVHQKHYILLAIFLPPRVGELWLWTPTMRKKQELRLPEAKLTASFIMAVKLTS